MGINYFTEENAWKHLYYITGQTADEFYTDGGVRVNIEQLIHMELKSSGYERIVFYDKDNKLYCYDDKSFQLLRVLGHEQDNSNQTTSSSQMVSGKKLKGLRRGKHAIVIKKEPKIKTACSNSTRKEPKIVQWENGKESNVSIMKINSNELHLGMQDTLFVKRQLDAYMKDKIIKTAIIINDPTSFINEFGEDPLHSLTAVYERMSADNKNIMIFLYTDSELGNLYNVQQMEVKEKNINCIKIGNPNVAEIRNMLMYFKINYDLKINIKDLKTCAVALRHAMSIGKKTIRIKELYNRLEKYPKNCSLKPDDCYKLLDISKPKKAEEQLNELIGMKNVKDLLFEYNLHDKDELQAFNFLTSSRLQPNKKSIKRKKEMIHFVLTGNPGTGKTTVAKLIGQLFYELGYLETGHCVSVDRSTLVGKYVGHTADQTRAAIERALGGVLFIDEAYSLKRSEDNDGDFGQEALDTLCKYMDEYKGQFIVVAAGYPREMEVFLNSNPGFASRFTKVNIDDYTPEEMHKIIDFCATKNKAVFTKEFDEKLSDFCENWVNLSDENWGNAREAVNLVNKLIRKCKNDINHKTIKMEDGAECLLLEEKHLPESMINLLKPVSELRSEALNRLNSMTGLAEVKDAVERLRRRMLSGDMKVPGHYVFSGNPGTGKTTVARYMGQILRNLGMLKRGQLIEYTATNLMAEVYNKKNNGNFEQVAKKAIDGVLFIDEAYQLVNDARGNAILDALLPFMENNRDKVCVILAGYEDDMMNLVRYNSGFKNRITRTINFNNYTGEELYNILLNMLGDKNIAVDEGFKENAFRALSRYVDIHGKEKTFGNARYVRTVFMPQCLDKQTDRLISEYGEDNLSPELKGNLIAEDIPDNMIKYTKYPIEKPDTRSAREKLNSLIGYSEIKRELNALLDTAEFNKHSSLPNGDMKERLHWVLEGNPGTGKTMIAKLIGQVYKECGILDNGKTLKVTRSDLVAGYQGQTAIKTRNCINKAMGGVLFIDEAYSLTKVEGNGSGYGQEAITELVEAMEDYNGEFAVIAAGYPNDMEDFLKANSGLSSRMKTFVLEDYTAKELSQIFISKAKEQKVFISNELEFKLENFFANKKRIESKRRDWGNGREVENLLRDMSHIWMSKKEYYEKDGLKYKQYSSNHIPENQQRYLNMKLKKEEKNKGIMEEIDNLIGFNNIKEKLKDLLTLKKTAEERNREDLLEDLNLHWVLKGNPGTGKTTIAKLIGKVYKEMGLLSNGRTKKVTRSDLVGEVIGATAPKTQKCIDQAMGGILFIDEAYSLKRNSFTGNDYGQEAIDTLLEQMTDKNGEFAVIAAGYPNEMDVFLNSNPGFKSRFDEIFVLEDYTAEELFEIFKLKCKNKKFNVDEVLCQQIKQMFDNMISQKPANWANGREAENLERKMRTIWAKNPIEKIDTNTGEKVSCYTVNHIPPEYKKYL